MGKLVAVVGNTGVGKTTLVNALCVQKKFIAYLEESENKPFQSLFAQDLERYALANQVDFLLNRATQESGIRKGNPTGVVDGGLEQDFHVYSRLFFQKGYLTPAEFDLCGRVFLLIREYLPPPELFVYLQASIPALTERFQKRGHKLRITQVEDMEAIEDLLETWLSSLPSEQILTIDSEGEDQDYSKSINIITRRLES